VFRAMTLCNSVSLCYSAWFTQRYVTDIHYASWNCRTDVEFT